jgi:integrase
MMRGHVRKRGKTWAIVYDEGDDEGKRRQRWRGGFATKAEAEDALNSVLDKLTKGDYVTPSKLTVAEYLTDWANGLSLKSAPLTVATYKRAAGHVTPTLGSKQLQKLNATHLDALYAKLSEDGMASSSIRLVHNVIHKALDAAVRKQLVTRNAAAYVENRPKVSRKPTRTWSVRELRAFLVAVEDDRLYAAYRFAGMTGVRRGELLGLRWYDVALDDVDNASASIVQTVIPTGGKRWMFSETKTGKGRLIDLDPKTARALVAHREAQTLEREEWGDACQDHDLIFTRENGEPLDPNRFSEVFAAALKRAKQPSIRLHDLRHTHATHMLAAGIHPKVVQERLGHSSIKITLDLYSHVTPGMQKAAASRVAELLDGAALADR